MECVTVLGACACYSHVWVMKSRVVHSDKGMKRKFFIKNDSLDQCVFEKCEILTFSKEYWQLAITRQN